MRSPADLSSKRRRNSTENLGISKHQPMPAKAKETTMANAKKMKVADLAGWPNTKANGASKIAWPNKAKPIARRSHIRTKGHRIGVSL